MPKKYSIKVFRKKFGWQHTGYFAKSKKQAKETAEWGYKGGPYSKYRIVPVTKLGIKRISKKSGWI